jgi:predicted RNA binding protein YcfA (HicA-like mRNA interferase family)
MSDRVRRMTAREVENLLKKHGFNLVSQKGSHQKWRNSETGLQVIVPAHSAALCRSERFAPSSKVPRYQSQNGRIEIPQSVCILL